MVSIKLFKLLFIALVCAYTGTVSLLAQGDDAPAQRPPIQAASGNANEAKLLEDARSGDLEAVQAAIRGDIDIHCRTTFGWNPLHIAAARGHLDIVTFLVQNYPQLIQTTTNKGLNPLHSAVANGQLNVVTFLAENYPQLIQTTTTDGGLNALHLAALIGRVDLVTFLAENYPQLLGTTTNDGLNALHFARQGRHLNIAEYIVTYLAQNHPQLITQAEERGMKRALSSTESSTADSTSRNNKRTKVHQNKEARTSDSKNEAIEVDSESDTDTEELVIVEFEELNQNLLTAAQNGNTELAKKSAKPRSECKHCQYPGQYTPPLRNAHEQHSPR